MDNLTYVYTGNRLTKVTDAVTTPVTCQGAFHFVDGANVPEEYTYDTNGNITRDLNRNITSITYNELNLPSVITMSGDKSVTYGYDAAGRKLSVVYKSGTTTTTSRDYVGNKVYNNGTLSIVLTEEGYTTASGTPAYYYHLKDHQGNNRVVISQSGAVQEVNHYYPFGGLFGEGVQPSIQRYKYNGKELDREFGLDMYDYGARHYDAALGRWFTVDPLAEKYYFISSYVYATNNPVNVIDPDGKKLVYLIRANNGTVTQLTYSKGNFFYNDGRVYNLLSGDYSKTAHTLLRQYRKMLDSGDKVLINQLKTLETSERIHWVEESQFGENSVSPYSTNTVSEDNKAISEGKGIGTQTQFDFSEKSKFFFKESTGVPKSDFTTVGHEMRHQYDYDTGNMKDSQNVKGAKSPAEKRAVNNENRARKIEKLPKRTTYGGEEIEGLD